MNKTFDSYNNPVNLSLGLSRLTVVINSYLETFDNFRQTGYIGKNTLTSLSLKKISTLKVFILKNCNAILSRSLVTSELTI